MSGNRALALYAVLGVLIHLLAWVLGGMVTWMDVQKAIAPYVQPGTAFRVCTWTADIAMMGAVVLVACSILGAPESEARYRSRG